jgi:hypothetical protein
MKKQLVLDPQIETLLDRLYAESSSQNDAMGAYFSARAAEGSLDWTGFDDAANRFLSDKLVARSREGGILLPGLHRPAGCSVVEAGRLGVWPVSRGASAHAALGTSKGVVIGTEYRPRGQAARANFAEASPFIIYARRLAPDAAGCQGPVDFADRHLDADGSARARSDSTSFARAVVIADNTSQFPGVPRLFRFRDDPANGLRTMTHPSRAAWSSPSARRRSRGRRFGF